MDSVLTVLLILGTPAVAIIGGIVAGILKMRGQQRLIELAIERGLDLSQLPLQKSGGGKVQGLMIGGVLTLALGIGLSATLLLMPSHDGGDAWPVGLVPICMGIALLISARIARDHA